MPDLTLSQLAEIVGGRLRFGTLPPVDGDLEQAGPIAVDASEVLPGDVYWQVNRATGPQQLDVHEALMRGAQGTVVADVSIEPWAGCFGIQVRDARQALLRLGAWKRRRCPAALVGVTGGPHNGLIQRLAQRLWPTELAVLGDQLPSHGWAGTTQALVNWNSHTACGIIDLGPLHHAETVEISALCSPKIIVINGPCKTAHHLASRPSRAFARHCTRLIESLANDAIVLVHDGDATSWQAACDRGLQVIRIGRGGDLNVTPTRWDARDGRLTLEVDGQSHQIAVASPHLVGPAILAVALVRVVAARSATRTMIQHQPAPPFDRVTGTRRGPVEPVSVEGS